MPNSYSIMSNHHSKNVVLFMCSCCFSATILLQKKNLCMQTSRDLFCKQVSRSAFLWQPPILFDLQRAPFPSCPVDLERFPPPGASQTFIAHASVEAKSRGGESSDNHKNNSSELSEDVFLELNLQL